MTCTGCSSDWGSCLAPFLFFGKLSLSKSVTRLSKLKITDVSLTAKYLCRNRDKWQHRTPTPPFHFQRGRHRVVMFSTVESWLVSVLLFSVLLHGMIFIPYWRLSRPGKASRQHLTQAENILHQEETVAWITLLSIYSLIIISEGTKEGVSNWWQIR